MALNPNIALQTQGINLPDFAGAYETVLNNRARREGMEQNRQLHQAQMDEYKRKTAAGEAEAQRMGQVRTVLSQGGTSKDVMGIDPDTALKLAEDERKAQIFELDKRTKELTEKKTQAEMGMKSLEMIGQTLNAAKDEGTFFAGLGNLIASKAVSREDVAPYLEEYNKNGWTPEFQQKLQTLAQQTISLKEQGSLKQQEFENGLRMAEEERKKLAFPLQQQKLSNEAAAGQMTLEERKRYNGMTAAEKAKFDADRADAAQRAADAAAGRWVTMRGQNMTDDRSREANKNARGNNLPEGAINKLEQNKAVSDRLSSLEATFDDKFAGNAFTGGIENTIGKFGGENVGLTTKGQTDWWQNYQDYINTVRKDLFGSALTPTEQREFEKAIISPSSNPNVIRTNIGRQKQIINAALARRADTYQAGGYNINQVDLYRPQGAAAGKQGPKVGTVEDGHVFLGGDPANPKSWKKQ